ncbi:MAG: tetratricopeptide repeat protein [Deltaproteobacteria bacterium]|nr:tetratricopeptide repeat protein [Deltaproteobacteria bacterium]
MASALAIACIVFVLYLPTLRSDFVNWDVDKYVVDNPNIRDINLSFIRYLFTPEGYPPITMLSFAIDYAFWGLNPLGYHLTNIVFHAFSTFLVFLLVVRLIECRNQPSSFDPHPSILISASVTAFLFGIHPLNVEPVAWVMGRGNLISPLFFFLSLIAYLKYNTVSGKRRWVFYTLCFLSYALSLMSKPISASLPIVLLIIDLFLLRRTENENIRTVLIEKLPFFLIGLIWFVVTAWARSNWTPTSFEPVGVDSVFVVIRAVSFYLIKILFPIYLAPIYPYPEVIDVLSFEYTGPIVLLSVITLSCILYAERNSLYLAIWLFYLASLLPTLLPLLGFYRIGQHAEADRYAYLSALGPFILIGLGVGYLFQRDYLKKYRIVTAIALTLVTGILINKTINQMGIWYDSITLWTHEIKVFPHTATIAYYNRGNAYAEINSYSQAIEDYNKAIELDPKHFKAYTNRGNAYYMLGNYHRAIDDYTRAIGINPSHTRAYSNRGNSYSKLGDYEKATKDYSKVRLSRE